MNHFLRRGICLGAWVAGCGMAHAQLAAVKTNALLWGNLTPNISMELVTASKFSLEGTVFYGLNKTPLDAQLKGAQAEFRYWISGRPMARSFIGLSVSGLRYTVVHKGKAHQGEAAGPGLTCGYAWPLSKRFNLEFSAGVGALWYREKKYPEGTYLKKEEYNANGVKCVPTEVAVSCCYLF